MERLPASEEQAWLLDCLAMLVRRRGPVPLLEAPILTPGELGVGEVLDGAAVGALTRRLLEHVGLGDQRVVVQAAPEPVLRSAPVWIASVEGDEVQVACAHAVDRTMAAGVLAHEVAHLWRDTHGLMVAEPDIEEQLTDLSAVYLGLGVLLGNVAAYRRAAGPMRMAPEVGALGPEAVGLLLAAQVLARRLGCLATCGVARALAPDLRRSFAEGLRALRRLEGGLHRRLGLPGRPPRPRVSRRPAVAHREPSVVDRDGLE